MAVYWITFRIADRTVDNRTYDQRYEALKETIRINCSKWWLKPTSFIAFESSHEIDALAGVCKKAIAPQYDMFLMRKMDHQTAVICGANDDRGIHVLIPYLKVV